MGSTTPLQTEEMNKAVGRKRSVSDEKPPVAVKLGRGRAPRAKSLQDAKDALYKEHIMDVAERIFADQGFSNAKMQDIASEAGISLGRLYLSYPSKTDLHRAILIARDAQMLNTVLARGQDSLQAPTSIEEVLWMNEAHLHFLLQHPDYLRMQLQEGHAWYHQSAQPTREEQAMWDRGLHVLKALFTWGMGQGYFSPASVEHQARMLLSLQQTRLANWVMDGMKASHESVVLGVQADFIRLFCRPEHSAKLLANDGSGLNEKTVKRIRALDKKPA